MTRPTTAPLDNRAAIGHEDMMTKRPTTKPTIADLLHRAAGYCRNGSASRHEAIPLHQLLIKRLVESDRRITTICEIEDNALSAGRLAEDGQLIDAVTELSELIASLAPVLGRDGEPEDEGEPAAQGYTDAVRAHHGLTASGAAKPSLAPEAEPVIRFNLHDPGHEWSSAPFPGYDMLVDHGGITMFAAWTAAEDLQLSSSHRRRGDAGWCIHSLYGGASVAWADTWPQGCAFLRWEHDPTAKTATEVLAASDAHRDRRELWSELGCSGQADALEEIGEMRRVIDELTTKVGILQREVKGTRESRNASEGDRDRWRSEAQRLSEQLRRLYGREDAPIKWIEADWRAFYAAAGCEPDIPLSPDELISAAREAANAADERARVLEDDLQRCRAQYSDLCRRVGVRDHSNALEEVADVSGSALELARDLVRAGMAPRVDEEEYPDRCGCASQVYLEQRLADGVREIQQRSAERDAELADLWTGLDAESTPAALDKLSTVRGILEEAADAQGATLVTLALTCASAMLRERRARGELGRMDRDGGVVDQ